MDKATTLLLCQPPTGLVASERLAWLGSVLAAPAVSEEKVAVFPELFLSGYVASVTDPAATCRKDRDALAEAQRLCERHGAWAVFGAVTCDDYGYRNSAVCLDPGGRMHAIHHKCRPFGDAEARAFVPGSEPPLFDTPLGRTGMAVCFDIEDSSLIADYAQRGAEIILAPTANMRPYTLVPSVKVRARALDNGLLIAYANYTGNDGEYDFPGDSLVIDADGEILGQLGALPGILSLRLPQS